MLPLPILILHPLNKSLLDLFFDPAETHNTLNSSTSLTQISLLFLFSNLVVAPDKGDLCDPSCFMSRLTFCLFHDRLLNAIKPGLVKKINRLPTPIAGLVSIQN